MSEPFYMTEGRGYWPDEETMTPNEKPLQPHQQRVVNERHELMFKVDKLAAFLAGEVFKALPADEQERLTRQHRIMSEYDAVLKERIAHFPK